MIPEGSQSRRNEKIKKWRPILRLGCVWFHQVYWCNAGWPDNMARPSSTQHTHTHTCTRARVRTHARTRILHTKQYGLLRATWELTYRWLPLAFLLFLLDTRVSCSVFFFFFDEQHAPVIVALQGQVPSALQGASPHCN